MNASSSASRQLRQAMTVASDGALSRVVAMLEQADNLEGAGDLLQPVRDRLRRIRPRRRLKLVRLLFLPLEGCIVDAQSWQRGSNQLPRSVLRVFGQQLRDAEPAQWQALEQAAHDRWMDEQGWVGQLGRPLWALAARAMPEQPPPEWQAETGLKPEHHASLLRLCIGVWRQASPLWDAVEAGADMTLPVLQSAIKPSLNDEGILSACLATLMHQSPTPWQVAADAGAIGPLPRLVAERALDGFIESSVPEISAAAPAASAERAEHFADVWEALENGSTQGRPERRQRLRQLRNEIDQSCRTAYAAALKAQLMAPIAEMVGAATDAEIIALEDRARGVRRLALAGRRIGGRAAYDQMEADIASAIEGIMANDNAADLNTIDAARLVEILCGSDAGAKLLSAPGLVGGRNT
ncbi:MAG: hypothetical protein NTW56_02235 [Alphaproteobacteria bacterium]|nr:hypothetical protein [Alphaproteobacteria bacterium]